MSQTIRILFLSDGVTDRTWLDDTGYHVIAGVEEPLTSDDLESVDLVVLDESLGSDTIRSRLAGILFLDASMPVLLSRSADADSDLGNIIRHGLQDILIKDLQTPDTIGRTFLNAIDRARILQAIQDAEVHVRTIVERISDAVLIVDPNETVLFANPACEDLFGSSLGDLFGSTLPMSMPSVSGAIVEIDRPDGLQVTASVSISPLRWEGREAVLLTMRDVTLEHQARKHLQKAKQTSEKAAAMKSSFLANMSHELRVPLASIIGFAQLISEADNRDEINEFADLIGESGNRLLATINTVLEATRLDSNTLLPHPEPVNLSEIVIGTVRLLEPLARRNGLLLETRGPDRVTIEADHTFLERIVNNLVSNAIKYSDHGRIITEWSVRGESARLTVADNGIGIAADFLPHVFDEFSQESSGRDRSHEGTGLGLSITRKLTELMGGKIEVDSKKGNGSTFTVTLPLHPPSS